MFYADITIDSCPGQGGNPRTGKPKNIFLRLRRVKEASEIFGIIFKRLLVQFDFRTTGHSYSNAYM